MLSRISVSRKLLLIYALDMIAVIFLGFSLAKEKYISINFARKEVAGHAYMAEVRDALFSLDAVASALSAGVVPDAAIRAAAEEKLARVEAAEAGLGAALSTTDLSRAMTAAGRRLLGGPPAEAEAGMAEFIAASRALIARIGDQSNLILDPDLDSYYAMSLVLLRFPELVDLVTRLRAKTHALGGRDGMEGDQRSEFLLLEGNLSNVIAGIRGDREAGYGGNADGTLRQTLAPGFAVLDNALADLVAAMRTGIIDHHGQVDQALVDRAVGSTLLAAQACWVQTGLELTRLLKLRIDGFLRRMWEHFALAGALLAIILSLVLQVARRIARPISHLADVAERVRRTNDYNLRASWNSRDEIGRLVDSFNTMLERLQAEGARREELAAQTRAAEAQHELIEAMPTPLTVTRLADGGLLHVNQPASALLGSDREGEAGDYLAPADRRRLLDLLRLHGAINEFEAEVVSSGGARFWALMSARLLSYRGDGALLTTITPITERKRMEEELRRSKNAAEEALRELRKAQQSLIQSEKMASLGGLVAGVAHEINTPVGIGLTGASTLAAETGKLRRLYAEGEMTEEDFQDYLQVAADTSQLLMSNMNRAAGLIQSFKQVAVDQTSAERRRFHLGSYIEEVLTSLHPTIKKGRHEVTVDCPAELELDSYPGAISQVLTNMVMNALLHAYDGGQAGRMRISVETAGDGVVLSFADDGKGIPAEDLPRIFDPFFTTRRSSGGSGLGLHIVYNLVVNSLSGEVAVDSLPGAGTTFTLRFPRIAPRLVVPAPVEE